MDFSIELDFSSSMNWVMCNGLLLHDGSASLLESQLGHERGSLQSQSMPVKAIVSEEPDLSLWHVLYVDRKSTSFVGSEL